ncbi:uncharacterized protein LOC100163728 isoform X1 [Acyrthosiphon pisum]|uniref:Defective in cullin neddylation protein n=2 Tax=Acyrthosiphon pisum TaxID=7029 RepID=C4WTR1_ACYPI|nr:uncharacterized protein LOC100163728 [Acyrthosiphon pisum]XP_008185851.1 uncharacterized protein LOC100163728 isoform X1 [Acyrthosiphon pisum]XP_008185852.1 uncharacterized protein LOC100163728 isoform X1 [Acyrthosiphon pisum]XP_016662184.1 uncharacterized protein LOC100163728 isoform X1 [Acyrthosiphon pisum]XP_016662185.1 uncharacterized protein LOC100163728 isoform X1 [Acyrthosiphon pisum]BAH71281.1 ACYPI004790 [Acyrthosiphon pisum]|eukprot:NP_001233035.1 uncharacterized protein LOC100163728 [Acyrthosiphon pisum]
MMARKRRSTTEINTAENASVPKRRYTSAQRTHLEEMMVFNHKKCLSWYHKYTNDVGELGPEGMEKFCMDIGVDPEDLVMLVLAWKMSAKSMGYFSSAEWLKGLTELQCDSVKKLQSKLESLRLYFNDPLAFKSIYRYAYDFARDKDQRSMDIETAKLMLNLLLGKQWKLYTLFAKFIDQSKYRVINKDQWCNILEFSRSIATDLANYDIDGAWPVMLDEFVDWIKNSNS